jgi:hypothetical protein
LAMFPLVNSRSIIGVHSNKTPPSPLDFSVYFFGSWSSNSGTEVGCQIIFDTENILGLYPYYKRPLTGYGVA